MVTDGKLKAICTSQEAHCQLFDLRADPREQKNLAAARPKDAERLRAELDAFLSTIPRVEAMAVSDGVGFPEALARAKLGAPGAGPDVVPLLGDPRAPVRAAAARALGELSVRAALPMLARVRVDDADENVRAEASIASLLLGDDAASDAVIPLLARTAPDPQGMSVAARAALALARLERVEALPVLSSLALDETAQEADRLRAIAALGQVGTKAALPPLVKLLADVRLRGHVAEALAEVGGKKAANALVPVLAEERYQPNRTALAWALVKLRDARVVPLVERFLGMETGIPEGVRILLESKALDVPSARGARIALSKVRSGAWQCEEGLCVPGEGAQLVLPRRPGKRAVRVTFLLSGAEPGAKLVVDGKPLTVRAAEEELTIVRPSPAEAQRFSVRIEGKGALLAVTSVLETPEIPPPPPEPWHADAGTPGEKSAP
jgi:HEAT repeat protein